jgi:hypothetical protein
MKILRRRRAAAAKDFQCVIGLWRDHGGYLHMALQTRVGGYHLLTVIKRAARQNASGRQPEFAYKSAGKRRVRFDFEFGNKLNRLPRRVLSQRS